MNPPQPLTYRMVQEHLRGLGIVMSKSGSTIRINYFGGTSDTAYLADNLADALQRGQAMAPPSRSAR